MITVLRVLDMELETESERESFVMTKKFLEPVFCDSLLNKFSDHVKFENLEKK